MRTQGPRMNHARTREVLDKLGIDVVKSDGNGIEIIDFQGIGDTTAAAFLPPEGGVDDLGDDLGASSSSLGEPSDTGFLGAGAGGPFLGGWEVEKSGGGGGGTRVRSAIRLPSLPAAAPCAAAARRRCSRRASSWRAAAAPCPSAWASRSRSSASLSRRVAAS